MKNFDFYKKRVSMNPFFFVYNKANSIVICGYFNILLISYLRYKSILRFNYFNCIIRYSNGEILI